MKAFFARLVCSDFWKVISGELMGERVFWVQQFSHNTATTLRQPQQRFAVLRYFLHERAYIY